MMMMLSSRTCAYRRRLLLRAVYPQVKTLRATSTSASSAAKPEPAAPSASSSNRSSSRTSLALVSLASLSLGICVGRNYRPQDDDNTRVLPNGLPRTCCEHDDTLTDAQKALPKKLKKIVGPENVLDGRVDSTTTLPFLKGARLGKGSALCIVRPEHLQEVVDCVQAIVDAGCVVLPQGQNTGLTGGSVPHTSDQRPVVILSMKHLNRIFPIDDGKRVVCLAGVGLASLQEFLTKYFPDRESHSVLGSTFLNPTTAAGIAFGSGGTQCRKGPAYTERALYLKITTNKWKENVVEVVNTLGIDTMEEKKLDKEKQRKMDSVPYRVDTWSRWISQGVRDMRYSIPNTPVASDVTYAQRLCRLDSQPARYNADTRGPEYNGSEGKVILLATVHDTFPKPQRTKTFWLSFDSLETALQFRKQVCLDNPTDMPVSCEYMDRDSFDVIDRSGRVSGNTIKLFGTTSPWVRRMWNAKLWIEALPFHGAPLIIDRFLYWVNNVTPAILPRRVMELGRIYDHHVALTVGDFGDGNMDRFLDRLQAFCTQQGRGKIQMYECTSQRQVASINAFRFVAATAFRTWCVGQGVQGFSVDYALPKNGGTAPILDTAADKPLKRMRYSHFGCNVVHEDLAYANNVDIEEQKHALKHTVEHAYGGRLPAEHGHGTEYKAPVETQQRWKRMDPLNVLNPGIGGLSERFQYEEK